MNDRHEDGQHANGQHEQVGGVAEEAAKLMGALAGWAREQGPDPRHGGAHGGAHGGRHGGGHGLGDLVGAVAAAAHQVDQHVATGAAECTWCPLCRTLHTVRSLSPEVRQHLGAAASALVQAAAGLLAGAMSDSTAKRRGRDVEHIDLDEDWPSEDREDGLADDWSADDWPDDWSADDWPDDGSDDGSDDDGPNDDGHPDPQNDEPGAAPEHEGPGD